MLRIDLPEDVTPIEQMSIMSGCGHSGSFQLIYISREKYIKKYGEIKITPQIQRRAYDENL